MITVYLDPNTFQCHTSQNAESSLIPYETNYFEGMCQTFIEGFRLVPFGKTWTRSDGEVFTGEMIAPWKPYSELDAAQREYERQKLADAENALAIMWGGVTV